MLRAALVAFLLLILVSPSAVSSTPGPFIAASFPAQAASPAGWALDGPPLTFPPDLMYQQVNGEAELFKRFGARSLHSAAYQRAGGASLTVDVLDCGREENAFGLFRLYTGCEEGAKERPLLGGRMMGETLAFAVFGPLFLKVNATGEGVSAHQVEAFLRGLVRPLPLASPLPSEVAVLEAIALAPCEVTFHPDEVDFSLKAGPGWRWRDRKGRECFATGLPTREEALALAARAKAAGMAVVGEGNAVAWSRATEAEEELARALTALLSRRGCLIREGRP